MAGPSSESRSDPFGPSAPLVPEAGVSVVQTQAIGSYAWQAKKLIREEQRLDRVAAIAGAKARHIATTNPGNFGMETACSPERTFKDEATGEERTFRVVVDNTNPHADKDRDLLRDYTFDVSSPTRDARAPAHKPELMSPVEKARRDAALPRQDSVEVYIPALRFLELGHQAILDAYASLTLLGADLSAGSLTTTRDEGGSVKVVWRRGDHGKADRW
jgi:hypothetical protein